MAGVLLLLLGLLPANGTLVAKLVRVFVPLSAGLAAYLAVAVAMRSEEWRFLRALVFQRGGGVR